MAKIIATGKDGSNIPPIEAGTHLARCYSMFHIGTIDDEFQGKKTIVNKVRIGFELPGERYTFDEERGEEPRVISKEYTLSLSEKANLRKMLEAWRSKPFTEEELEGFDVTAVVGHPCQITVVHKVGKTSGSTYADIASVSPVMKGVEVPDAERKETVFSYDLSGEEMIEVLGETPAFIFDKIKTSQEWKALEPTVIKAVKAAIEEAKEEIENEAKAEAKAESKGDAEDDEKPIF